MHEIWPIEFNNTSVCQSVCVSRVRRVFAIWCHDAIATTLI